MPKNYSLVKRQLKSITFRGIYASDHVSKTHIKMCVKSWELQKYCVLLLSLVQVHTTCSTIEKQMQCSQHEQRFFITHYRCFTTRFLEIYCSHWQNTSLIVACIDRLSIRAKVLTARFFKRQVLPSSSVLQYLPPCQRNNDTVNKLRNAKTFQTFQGRTNKFQNSFLPYPLSRFT